MLDQQLGRSGECRGSRLKRRSEAPASVGDHNGRWFCRIRRASPGCACPASHRTLRSLVDEERAVAAHAGAGHQRVEAAAASNRQP